MEKNSKIKLLIVDTDTQLTRQIEKFVTQKGFEVRSATTIRDARNILFDWHPKIVLCDLILEDGSGFELLKVIQDENSLLHDFVAFIMMSAHNKNTNVKQAIQKGVSDYVVKPFKIEELTKKLIFHCQNFRQSPNLSSQEYDTVDESSLMLHLTDLVLRQALKGDDLKETLYKMTVMLGMKTKGIRCSVLNCIDEDTGVVVVTNDDKNATGIKINLNKYPEILHAQHNRRLIAIDNISTNKHLKFIKDLAVNIDFNSLLVTPLYQHGEFFGVLSLRLPSYRKSFSDNELRFVEIVSHIMSLTLSDENHQDNLGFWLNAA